MTNPATRRVAWLVAAAALLALAALVVGLPWRSADKALRRHAAPQGYALRLPLVGQQGEALPPTATATATPSVAEGVAPLVTSTPLVQSDVSALPEATMIAGVPNQRQERSLNCELRSATDLAAFYGSTFNWEQLFMQIGYERSGDPNKGFVGMSIDDPPGGIFPAGYGVHAPPVADGLRRLGVPAEAHRDMSRDWLMAQVAAGQPVVVWARAGMMGDEPVRWQTLDGSEVVGVPYEHTFTVVGYDAAGVWVNDPTYGRTDHYGWSQFEASWAILGNMALTIRRDAR